MQYFLFLYLIIAIWSPVSNLVFREHAFVTPKKSEYAYLRGVDTSDFNVRSEEELINRLKRHNTGEFGEYTGPTRVEASRFGYIRTIYIRNDYSGDDSVGGHENKYTVQKENNKWKLLKFESRHACVRYADSEDELFSIFIHPYWTTKNCG